MILADDILAAGDGPLDVCGMLASLGRTLMKAERFVFDDDVVQAGRHILNAPSQILSALPICRSPYSRTWVEWGCNPRRPMQRNAFDKQRGITFQDNYRYMPDRMGCLIECPEGAKGDRGSLTYAWRIPDKGVAMSGISVLFNFTEDVVAWGHRTLEGKSPVWHQLLDAFGRPSTDQDAQIVMKETDQWQKLAGNSKEREALLDVERHTLLWISSHAWNFFDLALENAPLEKVRECMYMWMGDIYGETNFILTMLVMLNSRNAVEHVSVDLEKLNRARHKRGRPPFLSHNITHLQLSKARARDAEASGMTRAEMRAHMVRGHFKLRRTGVYWWSPFVRGKGNLIRRERYEVEP